MPGEVVGLLGDNGAGKSTLIKTLCGVHQPDTGGFVWEGEEVRFDSPRHAMATGISVVYQDLAVIPILSIYRNIFLGRESEVCRKVAGISFMLKQKAKEIAAEALTGLGIHVPDVESPVAVLSGGERQSISLARAVYFQHQLLILDEPTAALSPQGDGQGPRIRGRGAAQGRQRNHHHPQSQPRVAGLRPVRGPLSRGSRGHRSQG